MTQDKKRILIADDDPAILDVLMLFLEDCGYEVETTSDGTHVPALVRTVPDLLLLDLWMSGCNGRDLCTLLKSQETTKDLPIMLISANKETERIAKEAGADDFLSKPFDLDVLLKKIEHILSLRKAREVQ